MKFERFQNSLVFRIVLVGILLVVLAGIGRYLLLAQRVRTDLLQVVSRQQVSLAAAIAHEIDYKLEERQRFLAALADALPRELLDQPAQLDAWLQGRLQLQPMFGKGVLVLDADGRMLGASSAANRSLAHAYAAAVDLRPAFDGVAVIGRPLPQPAGSAVLPFGAPVRSAQGRPTAVLIGATALEDPDFLDRLQHQKIGATGGFLLISPRDRLFISADKPKLVLQPTPAPGVNLLHDQAMQGFRGADVTVNAFGIEEISAIASVPAAGWFVVARMPTAEALAAIDQTRRFITGYSLIEMVVAALIIGLLTARVLKPLHHAAEQANRMTDGLAPLSRLAVAREDEVGRLTQAFNQLIVKLADSQEKLQHMAHHDALTGLYNRNVLAERVALALHGARRSGHLALLLFIDLDGFKSINDELGHEAGDHFLKVTGLRLQAVTRASDTVARIGGDEFVLFVPDLLAGGETSEEAAIAAMAHKVIEAISVPIAHGALERSLGASIGIAVSDGDAEVDTLLAMADAAMYEAKRRGRQQFVVAPRVQQASMIGAV